MLARDIIETIDPNYLTQYDKLIENGELQFFYENDGIDRFRYCSSLNKGLIDINRKFNYEDVLAIVHEFIHYTNGVKENRTNNRYLLSEFFSIYFEEYAKKYLLEKGVSKDEINCSLRLLNTRKIANNFNWYSLVLLTYDRYGNIDENSIQLINPKHTTISKELFEEMCKKVLNHFEKLNKKYEAEILYEQEFDRDDLGSYFAQILKNYRYLLGTLFTYYAFQYLDMKDIVELNNHINDWKYSMMSLKDTLKTIGVNIGSKEFQKKLLSSLEIELESKKKIR